MQEELIYTGYRNFMSKKNVDCYVLDFITKPKKRLDVDSVYITPASIFVTKEQYEKFKTENKLLSVVKVNVEIVGNNVRYHLI